jgi:transcriptional regulator PpsR
VAHPDVTLVLDKDAVIRDVNVSNTVSGEVVKTWLGRPWIETVAESGIEKVRRSLDDARLGGVSAFSQIIQRFPSGLELPIEYTTVRLGDSGGLIAIGRNLQASSELQSRLIAAQQAMERDYWKLREVETRYRLLFDASNEAVIVLSSDGRRVLEANPSAIRALGLTRGWDFQTEMIPRERDAFDKMLARVREHGRAPGGVFHIGPGQAPWILRASLVNDQSESVFMVQLVAVAEQAALALPRHGLIANLLQTIPDGFVLLDRSGRIQSANQAFLDFIQVKSESEAIGQGIERWLRQPGAGLDALLFDIRQKGQVRLFETTIHGELGGQAAVEISAGYGRGQNAGLIGMVVRGGRVGAGALVESKSAPLLPALSREESTPLKALVQAAVSVVERHYVEAALEITGGNRTAAAERLGLSRQSLYVKLNRYGLEADKK